jgi:hypothetical protein
MVTIHIIYRCRRTDFINERHKSKNAVLVYVWYYNATYTAPRPCGFDYDPISMFSHVLYVYFFRTYLFSFSHKTIPRGYPKHVDISTMYYQLYPHERPSSKPT